MNPRITLPHQEKQTIEQAQKVLERKCEEFRYKIVSVQDGELWCRLNDLVTEMQVLLEYELEPVRERSRPILKWANRVLIEPKSPAK